jgi:hypothetical protein
MLNTRIGLALLTLLGVGVRLLAMFTIQQRRERLNRQINERLRTLIATYTALGGSFTGDLTVDPTHQGPTRIAASGGRERSDGGQPGGRQGGGGGGGEGGGGGAMIGRASTTGDEGTTRRTGRATPAANIATRIVRRQCRFVRMPLLLPMPPMPRGAPRLALLLVGILATAYVAVFIADGRHLSWGLVGDGVANAIAFAIVALAVVAFTRLVPWVAAGRWWFLPAHLVGAVVASLLSLMVTGLALGTAAWLRTQAWQVVWLQGPARNWQLFTAVFAYAAVVGGAYALQMAAQAREAQHLRRDAELAMLRARLNPHVMFNTLHSLLELVRGNDRDADDAVECYGRVVRYLHEHRAHDRELVTLRDEWSHMADYLQLEQLRLGSRLHLELHLDPAVGDARLPAVSLQPLVENAILHGIAPRPGAGTLTVRAWRDGHNVALDICDDGRGAEPSRAAHAGTHTPPSRNGTAGDDTLHGLALVRTRLHWHFHERANMSAGPTPGAPGWRVSLRWPA